MSSHFDNLAALAGMFERFERALNLMAQLTREAEGRPNWQFLESRMTDLKSRIVKLCDDVQVAAFERRGYYLPPREVIKAVVVPLKKVRKPEPQTRLHLQRKRAAAAEAELAAARLGVA